MVHVAKSLVKDSTARARRRGMPQRHRDCRQASARRQQRSSREMLSNKLHDTRCGSQVRCGAWRHAQESRFNSEELTEHNNKQRCHRDRVASTFLLWAASSTSKVVTSVDILQTSKPSPDVVRLDTPPLRCAPLSLRGSVPPRCPSSAAGAQQSGVQPGAGRSAPSARRGWTPRQRLTPNG
jgi:hypothetical protein